MALTVGIHDMVTQFFQFPVSTYTTRAAKKLITITMFKTIILAMLLVYGSKSWCSKFNVSFPLTCFVFVSSLKLYNSSQIPLTKFRLNLDSLDNIVNETHACIA